MTKKKSKTEKQEGKDATTSESLDKIASKEDLKNFLQNIQEKIEEEGSAPVYALSAMRHVLDLPEIYNLLDAENKEIARDIWLRLKKTGIQLRNPPLLFGDESTSAP